MCMCTFAYVCVCVCVCVGCEFGSMDYFALGVRENWSVCLCTCVCIRAFACVL